MVDVFIQQVMIVVHLTEIRDATRCKAECGVREIERSIYT
jgi:hypothetical protein